MSEQAGDAKKVGWSRWYRQAREEMRTRHKLRRVSSESYRWAFDAGHGATEAVDLIAAKLAELSEQKPDAPEEGK